jgi:hypothetical protein
MPGDGDPLRPASPRWRSPGHYDGDPLRPASPRWRSPLGSMPGSYGIGCVVQMVDMVGLDVVLDIENHSAYVDAGRY